MKIDFFFDFFFVMCFFFVFIYVSKLLLILNFVFFVLLFLIFLLVKIFWFDILKLLFLRNFEFMIFFGDFFCNFILIYDCILKFFIIVKRNDFLFFLVSDVELNYLLFCINLVVGF